MVDVEEDRLWELEARRAAGAAFLAEVLMVLRKSKTSKSRKQK